MNWLRDKAALLLAAVACAGAAWGLIHYSGEWFYLLLFVLAFAGLYADNQRLRARLREMGVDPSRRARR
ncbi:MAG: hypothetical protein PPHEMADM_0012 [uncultured Paraburkholderia sp.]|nr:MAG: hypothetical protein PPHEINF_0042 [uncultured Paraburkholderia sp.]CAH2773162.1 MAG: hypothetical protein PPHEESC_0042 [uncultured Paraburkholderia sp.]CAH2891647.1 MAG: hypothetical protein PPHEMADE_0013 [uncultured Paraburkholderia sp.]CAH2907495.1 MAG: hypothetical protein PPHEMADM_0012 [uncultured Paraburkholderia sp.]CAH2908458.1 MAG: hypothetical protein PPHERAN_0246 [uncultured Paraburkholderia sp.]